MDINGTRKSIGATEWTEWSAINGNCNIYQPEKACSNIILEGKTRVETFKHRIYETSLMQHFVQEKELQI